MLNQIMAALGIPRVESASKGLGMTAPFLLLRIQRGKTGLRAAGNRKLGKGW